MRRTSMLTAVGSSPHCQTSLSAAMDRLCTLHQWHFDDCSVLSPEFHVQGSGLPANRAVFLHRTCPVRVLTIAFSRNVTGSGAPFFDCPFLADGNNLKFDGQTLEHDQYARKTAASLLPEGHVVWQFVSETHTTHNCLLMPFGCRSTLSLSASPGLFGEDQVCCLSLYHADFIMTRSPYCASTSAIPRLRAQSPASRFPGSSNLQ